jgi:hypothetical protein
MDRDKMSNVYIEPSIDASYQISEDKNFKNQPIRNKSHLWWPCLLMDRDEMDKLYRGPSIDASSEVSVHFAKRFQRRRFLKISNICNCILYLNKSYLSFNRFFRNQPIRNKNYLWRPCLLTVRDKMSNLYRGPSIDASYQVSVHLAKRFHQRRFLEIDQSEKRIAYGSHAC